MFLTLSVLLTQLSHANIFWHKILRPVYFHSISFPPVKSHKQKTVQKQWKRFISKISQMVKTFEAQMVNVSLAHTGDRNWLAIYCSEFGLLTCFMLAQGKWKPKHENWTVIISVACYTIYCSLELHKHGFPTTYKRLQ